MQDNHQKCVPDGTEGKTAAAGFSLANVSLGAACWWGQYFLPLPTRRQSQQELALMCLQTATSLLEAVVMCHRESQLATVLGDIVRSEFVVSGGEMIFQLLQKVQGELLDEVLGEIGDGYSCSSQIVSAINNVYKRHHLPLVVCAVPTLLPKEHTHAKLANGQSTMSKAGKIAPTLPTTFVLGDGTSLSMAAPFSTWYSFDVGTDWAAAIEDEGEREELMLTQRALAGDFESFLRQGHARQPLLWDLPPQAPLRISRPAKTVTFAPSRMSPCYGLRSLTHEDGSDTITNRVIATINETASASTKEKDSRDTGSEMVGSIVRVPSRHPLHPIVCSLLQNQDESTMLVGDPAEELPVNHAVSDDVAGDGVAHTSSTTAGSSSSVSAIINKLPPHPLRSLVQGLEDFMTQADQRHRRLTQFVDFLCKRCDGDMTLMLKALPARHRTRLNAAIFDTFEKDDEDCFEVLGKPHLWNTQLKDLLLKEYAVSMAMRPTTLAAVSSLLTSTGAGALGEQMNRYIAMGEEMLKGTYSVLGTMSRLTEAMVSEEERIANEANHSKLPSPDDCPSTEVKSSAKKNRIVPVIALPFPLERAARLMVERCAICLSDSALELGGLLRIPPPPMIGIGEKGSSGKAPHSGDPLQTMVITVQSFANIPMLEKRLRYLVDCVFPETSSEENIELAPLQTRYGVALRTVVFGQLWPMLVGGAQQGSSRPEKVSSRRQRRQYLRPHQLMCLEALLVLLDTMAAVEKGCDGTLVDCFYAEFVCPVGEGVAPAGGGAGHRAARDTQPAWIAPQFCSPNEVITWLCTAPSPFFLPNNAPSPSTSSVPSSSFSSSASSRPSQQTSSSAAGLVILGMLIEALAIRSYVSTVCDSMLDYWDEKDDEAVTEDEVGATGALREFNFCVERKEHPSRARLLNSLIQRKTHSRKRCREGATEDDPTLTELVTGNLVSNASRYAHSMLLTMPDTLTITQLYEGY